MNNKQLIVQKYGGTSLGGTGRINNVISIIDNYINKSNNNLAVVVSAFNFTNKTSGTTSSLLRAMTNATTGEPFNEIISNLKNQHIGITKELLPNNKDLQDTEYFITDKFDELRKLLNDIHSTNRIINGKEENIIAKTGEQLAAFILSKVINDRGIKAEYVDLSEIFYQKEFSSKNIPFFAILENKLRNLISPMINENVLPIITGYMGEWAYGIVTTIGRGYSDLTASLVAGSLSADECQIWKDVDGIFTADPKSVTNAKLLTEITPEEVSELTFLGSEVLHPYTLEQTMRTGVPLRIRNTFQPELQGTLIRSKIKNEKTDIEDLKELVDDMDIKSLATKREVTLIKLAFLKNLENNEHNHLSNIYKIFKNYNTYAKQVTDNDSDFSIVVEENNGNLDRLTKELEKFGKVSLLRGYSTVSVVGRGIREKSSIAGNIVSCLTNNCIPIKMITQGDSKIDISCLLESKYLDRAISTIHENFIINNNN